MPWTVEECTIIKNHQGSRQELIDSLKSGLAYYTDGEVDLASMAISLIRKLTAITDQAYAQIDTSQGLELEE